MPPARKKQRTVAAPAKKTPKKAGGTTRARPTTAKKTKSKGKGKGRGYEEGEGEDSDVPPTEEEWAGMKKSSRFCGEWCSCSWVC